MYNKSQQKTEEQENIEQAIFLELIGLERDRSTMTFARTVGFTPVEFKMPENTSKLSFINIEPTRKSIAKENSQNSIEEKKTETEKEINSIEKKGKRNTNTSSFPHSVHGVILVKKSEDDVPRWGSGILVGPDIVLTAAHNVYDDEKPIRKRYPSIKFIPGVNGDEAPFGEIEVDSVFAPDDYINHKGTKEENGANGDDYAVVILKKPIGRETGYFGLHLLREQEITMLKSKKVFIVGYAKSQMQGQLEQWKTKGKILDYNVEKELIHCNLVANGQSGGGVFYKDSQRYVLGIYLGGNNFNEERSSVCLVTIRKFQQIYYWIQQAKRQKLEEILQGKDDENYITKLNFRGILGPINVKLLSECGLSGLEELDLSDKSIDEVSIQELGTTSKWPNLRSLNLGSTGLGDKGCQFLIKNKAWKNLKVLNLRSNDINEAGLSEIIQNSSWPELEELTLSYNSFEARGALLIGACTSWQHLKLLDLSGNKIDDEGAAGIAKNVTWKNLESLILRNNSIGDEGACSIAMNTVWVHLKHLDLSGNQINCKGGMAIGENTLWKMLEKLDLSHNRIGGKGAVSIGINPAWVNLKYLELPCNEITDEGGIAIGSNTVWKDLRGLNLSNNELNNKGTSAIANNIAWNKLEDLALIRNDVDNDGAIALARNTSWKRLRSLILTHNKIGWGGAVMLVRNSAWTKIKIIDLTDNKKEFTQEKANSLIANSFSNSFDIKIDVKFARW